MTFGNRLKVLITHVKPDNIFYMQLDTEEAYALEELSVNIRKLVTSGGQQVLNPTVGINCFALSEVDNIWYRALITKCDGSKITVYYVDYGNCEQLPMSNLRSSSGSEFNSSYQAIQCTLSDFISTSSGVSLNSMLQGLILNQELDAVIQSRCSELGQSIPSIPCYYVTLFKDEKCTETVAEELIKSGHGQFRICNSHVEIGKHYNAYASFDDSPGKFWIQFSERSESLGNLMETLNSTEIVGSLQPLPTTSMYPGVACCCIYDEDGSYYRAEIVSVNRSEKKATICFVDYGNYASVMLPEIKQLPPLMAFIPSFAVQCCLEGVKPIKTAKPDPKLGKIAWSKEACTKFNGLIHDMELKAHIISEISPEIYGIHLQVVATGDDIGKVFCNTKFAEVAVPKGSLPVTVEPTDYKYLELDINKAYRNLFISHAESPAIIWCQPGKQVEEFDLMMTNLTTEAPSFPLLGDVKVNQPCCVLYPLDQSWCRGSIQNSNSHDHSALVLFVDYGNVETIKHRDIKALPAKYMSLAAQATSFSLAGITPRGSQDWTKEAIEYFQDMVVERSLNCKIVDVDEDGYPAGKLYNPQKNNKDIGLEMVNRGYASEIPQHKFSPAGSSYNASSPLHSQKGSPQKVSPASSRYSSKDKSSPYKSPGINSPSQTSNLKYSRLKFNSGQSVEATVCYINSPTEFYIQLNRNANELEQLMGRVDDFIKSPAAQSLTLPRPGLPILAQYSVNNGWYRAIVLSHPSKGTCEIRFVDFGNSESTEVSNMVQVIPEFLKFPAQAILCSLNGIQTNTSLPESAVSAFENMSIGHSFQVHIVSSTDQQGEEVHSVDLESSSGDSVLKQLVNQGFFQEPPSATHAQVNKVSLPRFPLNQPLDVVMSYVETPSSFFLQLADSYIDLERLSDGLNDHYSKMARGQEVLTSIQAGSFCVAQFSEDELWYRARITMVKGNVATVTYIDFGNSEEKSISALRILKPEFSKFPCMGLPCSLAGIESTKEYSIDRFLKLAEKKLVGIFKAQMSSYEDKIPVRLTDTSKPEMDVVSSIFTGDPRKSIPIKAHIPTVTPVLNSPMESIISHLVNPEEFYCQLNSEKTVLDNLTNKMYAFYGENKEGSPVLSSTVGSYCASLYSDGNWYRGKITAISPGGASVLYLDYGNTESVDSSSIRALEPEFFSVPIQAMKCRLAGTQPVSGVGWSGKCISKIQDVLMEKEVEAIYLEGDESSGYGVQLILDGEDVADILQRKKLADRISLQPVERVSYSQESFVINPYPIEEGSDHDIIVTYALSPLEFYAQIIDPEELLDILMQEIANYCASPACGDFKCNPGDTLLAQFTEDDSWYRGIILNSIKNNSFEVFYLDYGNSEMLDRSRLRRVEPKFCNLPAQAIKCRLEGAQYYKYTEKSTQAFNDILLNNQFKMKCISVSEDNTCAINLSQFDNNFDVMSLAIDRNIVQAKISTVSPGDSSKLSIHMFPDGITVDSFHDVIIVHVESPSNFFCQFSVTSIDALQDMMNEMQEVYSSAPSASDMNFKIGDFVVALFSEDGMWYRAVVNDIQSEGVNVLFVDYGNSEVTPSKNLRRLEPSFVNLPAQAVPCCLAEILPLTDKWSAEACDEFNNLVLNYSFIAQIKSSEDMSRKLFKFGDSQQLEISLINAKNSKSPAEELVQLGLARLPTENDQSNLLQQPYIYPDLKLGEEYEVYVSNIESPSSFWLQYSSSEDTLSSIQDSIGMIYSDNPAEYPVLADPFPGTTCCAKFSQDQQWYRGTIKAKHPNGIEVLFVDYGNSEIVSPSEVRVMNPELLACEVQAFQCILDNCHPALNSEEWGVNPTGIFSELVMDKLLHTQVISKADRNCWRVKLLDGDSDVCNQLVQCGVAIKDVTPADTRVPGPQISQVQLSVGQSYSVYIAYIDSPSKFFCQLTSDYDKLESLMAEIADFYNANTLEPLLEEGAYCVAQYSSNFAWYRAQIMSIEPIGILVNFIDYGNSELVSPDNILALGSQFATLPSQAVSCSLVEDIDCPFSADILESFIEYDLNQEFSVCIKSRVSSGQYFVQLFNQEGNLVNNSLLSGQMVMTPSKSPTSVPPNLDIPPAPSIVSYQPLHYDIGSSIETYICHIISPTSFFCQPLELAAELDDMMADIVSYMSSEPYQPLSQENFKSGMVCLGQYTEDNEWYRGVIEEVISESTALVNLVDYGNREVLSSDRISILPLQFTKLPLQSFHCSVFGSDKGDITWNVDQVQQFQVLVPSSEQFTVSITGFSEGRNQYTVIIYRNGQPINFEDIAGEKCDASSTGVTNLGTLDHSLVQMHTASSSYSMVAIKGSSKDSGSDDGETESDEELEGKLLIKGPFQLSLAVQEKLEVSVVYVESPSLIYIQRTDCQVELESLSEEIAQYCTSFEEGQQNPLIFCEGDIVLAKWSEDEMWYRGEVIGVDSSNDNTSKVTFIDYGNSEVISSENLVPCPRNFLELPAQAIPCSLAQVPHSDSWTIVYKDLITKLVEGRIMQASVVLPGSEGMKPTVMLKDLETGADVTSAVLEKLQEECESGSNEVIEEVEEEVEEKENEVGVKNELIECRDFMMTVPQRDAEFFTLGSSHQVYVISNSGPRSFICQLSSESEAFNEMTSKLHKLYVETETSSPEASSITEGSYVTALFSGDMQWYRAKIIECSGEFTYNVLFIDFGNSGLVPLKNIRVLDESLVLHPPFAVECFLSGIEAPSNNLQFPPDAIEKMSELVGEDECTIQITTVDNAGLCGVVLTSSDGIAVGTALIEANLAAPLDKVEGSRYESIEVESEFSHASHETQNPSTLEQKETNNPEREIPIQTQIINPEGDLPTAELLQQSFDAEGNENSDLDDIKTLQQSVEDPDMPKFENTEKLYEITDEVIEGEHCVMETSQEAIINEDNLIPKAVSISSDELEGVLSSQKVISFPPQAFHSPEQEKKASEHFDEAPDSKSPFKDSLFADFPAIESPASSGCALEGTLQFASKYPVTSLAVGSQHPVKVTSVSTLEDFTCRFIEHQDQVKELIDAIATRKYQIGKYDKLVCKNPKPSLPVCACFSKDDVWHRGEIISAGQVPDTYKVLYVDSGNTEILPLERLKYLENCFADSLPPQAVRCSLPILLENDINPELPSSMDSWELDWPTRSVQHFNRLTDGNTGLMMKIESYENDKYIIDLFDCEYNVRETLVARLRNAGGLGDLDHSPFHDSVEEEGESAGSVANVSSLEAVEQCSKETMPAQETVCNMESGDKREYMTTTEETPGDKSSGNNHDGSTIERTPIPTEDEQGVETEDMDNKFPHNTAMFDGKIESQSDMDSDLSHPTANVHEVS